MSFGGGFDAANQSATGTNAEINMVPLIDVMLVLLVIFLITAPLITHSINVQLPQVNAQSIESERLSVDVAITAAGEIFFGDEQVTVEGLPDFLAQLDNADGALEVRIRADEAVHYGRVAETMSALKDAGLSKIGFITQAQGD